jgi:hypothetical protein
MQLLRQIINFLNYQIDKPALFGIFHLVCIFTTIAVAIVLCILWYKGKIINTRRTVFVIGIVLFVFEMIVQILSLFKIEEGIVIRYDWSNMPIQLLTLPMFVAFVAGLTDGRVHRMLCSYLATVSLFVGTASLLIPAFSTSLISNVHDMIFSGAVVIMGIFLYYTRHVYSGWDTPIRAIPVFAITLSVSVLLNELAHLLNLEGFNALLISPHYQTTIPVYSWVHNAVVSSNKALYPLSLVFYVLCVAGAVSILFLFVRGVEKIATTDYNEQYAEMDQRRRERIAQRNEKLRLLEEQRKEALKAERERRKIEQEERKERLEEEREARRDARRDERQKERARRKKERKRKRKERLKRKREKRREKRQERREERAKEKRIEKRIREIEKREKEEKKQRKAEEKAAKKALKEQKKLEKKQRKEEEKALKEWIKREKRRGNDDPDINEFYDMYYD